MLLFKDDRFSNMSPATIKQDLIAGITVGIVAIPLGMAFAIASGVKPEYGLYTTIIAGIVVALFGGSRFQVAGPTGAFIPILLAIVLQYGYENLLIAGFMAGIMLILMGAFKLGNLIKFIPRSVTIGFTSGIAVIIFSGQIGSFLGLEGLEKKEYFHQNALQLYQHLHTINFYSILIALLGLLIIIFLPKLFPNVPALLFAIIIPTILAVVLFPDKVATIGTAYGGITASLPTIQIPHITWEKIWMLWQPAFVIAMLGGIESLLSAVVSDGMTGKRHRSNRELVGQGIANMTVPLFGGIPATGAIARTATNINSGAFSPLSSVFQSLFVLVVLVLFAPYASAIPLASMAPILMVVAFNMSEHQSFAHILKLRTSDSIVLVVTFLLTVFINLTAAVQIGLLLAMISFIKRMSETFEVEKVVPVLAKRHMEEKVEDYVIKCPQLSFYTIDGPLFFGAADRFQSIITRSIHRRPKVLILKMKHVPLMDATAIANLDSLVTDFRKMGGITLISEINGDIMKMLMTSGLYDKIGQQHFFFDTTKAVDYGLQLIQPKQCTVCARSGSSTCRAFQKSKQLEQTS